MTPATQLLFVLCVFVVNATCNLSEDHLHLLKHYSDECMESSGVSHESLARATTGEFTSDPNLAHYFLCMYKKPGFMNDAGEFVIENIKEEMVKKYGQDVADRIVRDCVDFDGSTPERAAHFAKCIFDRKSIQMM